MLNPISAALRKKGITQGEFAKWLWEHHADLFDSLDPETRSLEARLSLLGKGERLEWWEDHPGALEVIAQELGMSATLLTQDRGPAKHVYRFPGFPALPALDLKREERYGIGRPEQITDQQKRFRSSLNLEHWFFGDGANRSPQVLDWLQIEDDTEFRLVSGHLAVASRHKVLQIKSPSELFAQQVDVLRHRSPLIVAFDEQVNAGQLQSLRDRAEKAPLLVISRHSLPRRHGGASQVASGRDASDINTWQWILHSNWRGIILTWVEDRLAAHGMKTATSAKELGDWLLAFDPGQRWCPRSEDVLQLCRIAQGEHLAAFNDIDRSQNVRALFDRIFQIKSPHFRLMESVIRKRWCDWTGTWDGELDKAGWLSAGISAHEFDTLNRAGHIAPGDSGYRFTNPLMARLLLRQVLGKQIRTSPPKNWWPACFDGSRRPLLDATLDTMSMTGLAEASRLQSERISKDEGLMGAAEALFVAIGKRLSRGAVLMPGMRVVGEIVFARVAKSPETTRPWSRPLHTIEQQFEWISSTSIWSLQIKAPKGAAKSWFVPGWASPPAGKFPETLNPRSRLYREEMPFPRGTSLEYFSDSAYEWSKTLKSPPLGDTPALFVPALLWRAACGAWPVNPLWWGSILAYDWCEEMFMRFLPKEKMALSHDVARVLWPSLVAWLEISGMGRGALHTLGKEIELPSCRPDAQRFSPSFNWVAEQLTDLDVLRLLKKEQIKYLEEHPQWLLTKHKMVVLRSLAKRLPFDLQPYMIPNYFSAFLPDAVEGLSYFLHDAQLGFEAAIGIWNWAPQQALEILGSSKNKNLPALTQLVLTCPTQHLVGALPALRSRPGLLPDVERERWVQYHLPFAGIHASELFEILRG